jgi:uncharacterized protein (DUF58 family)
MSGTIEIRLEEIRYWVSWLAQGFASGAWASVFRGRGFDFRDIVPYDDDPDPVRINWPASLMDEEGELAVTVFAEERNLNVYLLANLCPSMAFGSAQAKQERVALLAALLSYAAYRKKDRFRFISYTDEVEVGFPSPRDRDYPFLLAEAILRFDWKGKERGGLLRASRGISRQRSLVLIVSDFLGSLDGVPETLELLAPRHDIVPIVLWDRREVELPSGFGLFPLRDIETGKMRYVLLSRRTRRAHKRNIDTRRQEIKEVFGRFGIQPFFFTEVAETDLEALIRLFWIRRARL